MPRAGSLGQRARGCCCVYTQQTELRHPPAAWRPAVPSSRPVLHTAPCFLEDSEGCHAMGHPADQIPPSLGAPAVLSHCVRMDGGMGGLQVKSRTRPRPCAKFPAASKFFLEPGWWRRGTRSRYHQRSDVSRVIPAWAENTPLSIGRNCNSAGHPRVGGEHPAKCWPQLQFSGSSPRGRGTPLERPPLRGVPRVMGGEHFNCKQLICREFTACKRATEQYTQFGDAI